MKSKFLIVSIFLTFSFVFQSFAQSSESFNYRIETSKDGKAKLFFTWVDASEKITFIIADSKKMPQLTFRDDVAIQKGEEQLIFSDLVQGQHYFIQIRVGDFVTSLGGLYGVKISSK